jgi:hypothetical protein
MSDFGVLVLLAEGASDVEIQALADRISPDLIIVADRPASELTANTLMSALRHLPDEVITVTVEGTRIQNSADEMQDPDDFYTDYLTPLLLRRVKVLLVVPARLLDAIARRIDPGRMEGSVASEGGITFGFDRWMRARKP